MNQDKFGGKHNVIYDDANRMFSLKRLLLNSENILRLKAVLDAVSFIHSFIIRRRQ